MGVPLATPSQHAPVTLVTPKSPIAAPTKPLLLPTVPIISTPTTLDGYNAATGCFESVPTPTGQTLTSIEVPGGQGTVPVGGTLVGPPFHPYREGGYECGINAFIDPFASFVIGTPGQSGRVQDYSAVARMVTEVTIRGPYPQCFPAFVTLNILMDEAEENTGNPRQVPYASSTVTKTVWAEDETGFQFPDGSVADFEQQVIRFTALQSNTSQLTTDQLAQSARRRRYTSHNFWLTRIGRDVLGTLTLFLPMRILMSVHVVAPGGVATDFIRYQGTPGPGFGEVDWEIVDWGEAHRETPRQRY